MSGPERLFSGSAGTQEEWFRVIGAASCLRREGIRMVCFGMGTFADLANMLA
jgi:hypothetical protein